MSKYKEMSKKKEMCKKRNQHKIKRENEHWAQYREIYKRKISVQKNCDKDKKNVIKVKNCAKYKEMSKR